MIWKNKKLSEKEKSQLFNAFENGVFKTITDEINQVFEKQYIQILNKSLEKIGQETMKYEKKMSLVNFSKTIFDHSLKLGIVAGVSLEHDHTISKKLKKLSK